MAFNDFTLDTARRRLGLTITTDRDLFAGVPPVQPGATLRGVLSEYGPLATAIDTEKARGELLIAPLLAEVWRLSNHRVSVFSDAEFNIDAELGLKGWCDYLLGLGPQLAQVTAPLLAVVEAKRESLSGGLGQCAAEMVAVQRFNAAEGTPQAVVHGAVTSGSLWRFLRLEGVGLAIDIPEYTISQPERIIGVLLHMLGLNGPIGATGTAA